MREAAWYGEMPRLDGITQPLKHCRSGDWWVVEWPYTFAYRLWVKVDTNPDGWRYVGDFDRFTLNEFILLDNWLNKKGEFDESNAT